MYRIKYEENNSKDFSNIEQAIKNAQATWKSKEVQESLKITCQNFKKLKEEELKKDNMRFIVAKLQVKQWLKDNDNMRFIVAKLQVKQLREKTTPKLI